MEDLQKYLLDDQQMNDFVGRGFLRLNPPLGEEFHAQVYEDTVRIFEETGDPRDDIYDAVPLMKEVFRHPMVRGALTSVLGEGYFMYPHRHCHFSPPGFKAQHNHKDSIPHDHFVRHHRCRWALAFYYPQDTVLANGPTGVRPGTQYFVTEEAAVRHDEIPMVGKAGDVLILHYDIWHRGLSNSLDRIRLMNKFLFCRSGEPVSPSWASQGMDPWPRMTWGFNHNATPVWNSMLDWNRGEAGAAREPEESLDALRRGLRSDDEHVAMNAAYGLAASGEDGSAALFEQWQEEAVNKLERNIAARLRNPSELISTHGITAAGKQSVPKLERALQDENWWIRASAADRLGDVGRPALSSIPALMNAMQDSSEWVRRNAAFSLGVLDDEGVSSGLLGRHLSDASPRVAQNASLALCKMARQAGPAKQDLTEALVSNVKYVKSNSQLALQILETGAGHG